MKTKAYLSLIVLLCLAYILMGCGGSSSTDDDLTDPGIQIEIEGNVIDETKGDGGSQLTFDAPLAGATVIVKDYDTGAEVGTGTLDEDGKCTLTVPTGKPLAIEIIGTKNGKNYRLTNVVDSPSPNQTVTTDPKTTLAAEAIMDKYPVGTGVKALGQEYIQERLSEAATFLANYLQDNPLADLGVGGDLFDEDGGLTEIAQELKDLVPDIDQALALAKNAITNISQAGIPLAGMIGEEPVHIEETIMSIYDGLGQAFDAYMGLGERLDLIFLAIEGAVLLDKEEVSVFELEMGKVYTVSLTQNWYLNVDDVADGAAGQIKLEVPVNGETVNVVVAQSGANWTITQTSTGDPLMEYVISLPNINPENLGKNPTLNVSISLEDEEFPTPITFTGTVGGTGNNNLYTTVNFNGNFTSPNLTLQGQVEVKFLSSVPEKAGDDTIYSFPTSITLTNGIASISVANGDKLSFKGNASAQLSLCEGTWYWIDHDQNVHYDYGSHMEPTKVVVNNSEIVLTKDNKDIKIVGDISVDLAMIEEEDEWPGGGGEWVETFPKDVTVNGEYTNEHTGLAFEGSIIGKLTNVQTASGPEDATGSIKLDGKLAREGYPTYRAILDFAKTAASISLNADLRAGGIRLTGTGTATLGAEGVESGNLTLTDQNAVAFALSLENETFTGQVTYDGEEQATITEVGSLLKVEYKDGKFFEIPL